ncbi:MAG: hypothetical protein U0694_09185 [Anaerolineae bacterium]
MPIPAMTAEKFKRQHIIWNAKYSRDEIENDKVQTTAIVGGRFREVVLGNGVYGS